MMNILETTSRRIKLQIVAQTFLVEQLRLIIAIELKDPFWKAANSKLDYGSSKDISSRSPFHMFRTCSFYKITVYRIIFYLGCHVLNFYDWT